MFIVFVVVFLFVFLCRVYHKRKNTDTTKIISKNQSGFRKGFSTTDNIFIMHALVSIYFSLGKKLYCTFVDFLVFL
jgi:heme/copper-type cytochrome/quinol oxidase subunit 2